MRATMDLIAAYNYDPSVLDLLELPEAIDRPTLIDNLLMETAEREIIYSNIAFLKQAIGSWSKKNKPVWEELYKTTQYEYNPIWNKDGTTIELETRNLAGSDHTIDNTDRVDNLSDAETRNLSDQETRDLTDLETRNLTDTETRNLTDLETKNLSDSNLHSVYGFNSSSAAPESEDEGSHTGTDTIDHTGTDTLNHTGTDTLKYTGTDTVNHTGTDTIAHTGRQDIDRTLDKATTDTGTIKHEKTEQGNIGTTSTQSLILEQREVVKMNILDIIIDDFQNKFCLGIY